MILTFVVIQLCGIAEMFSRVMTLASAWIHLLAVDLFAARLVSLCHTSVCFGILTITKYIGNVRLSKR